MKHMKKNLTFLYILVTPMITQGLIVVAQTTDNTWVIPSLLADRKKSDTLSVSIQPILSSSVPSDNTASQDAPEFFQTEVSASPALLGEEVALRALLKEDPDKDIVVRIEEQMLTEDEGANESHKELSREGVQNSHPTYGSNLSQKSPAAKAFSTTRLKASWGTPQNLPSQMRPATTKISKTHMQRLSEIIRQSHNSTAKN
jgi:hypothetical protein